MGITIAVGNPLYQDEGGSGSPKERKRNLDMTLPINIEYLLDALRVSKRVHARRYRNPRLGEFLKELDLTEGRATGIPTVQEELEANGSPKAKIETDEERSYFLIDIPCHPEFMKDKVVLN